MLGESGAGVFSIDQDVHVWSELFDEVRQHNNEVNLDSKGAKSFSQTRKTKTQNSKNAHGAPFTFNVKGCPMQAGVQPAHTIS